MIGVCDVAGFVPAANIRVTYSNGGLGYVGRAAGPVAIVTVSIHDIPFNFFMLDRVFRLGRRESQAALDAAVHSP